MRQMLQPLIHNSDVAPALTILFPTVPICGLRANQRRAAIYLTAGERTALGRANNAANEDEDEGNRQTGARADGEMSRVKCETKRLPLSLVLPG